MRKLRPLNRNLSGFTLIELLMAVLLIAILATIAITQFTNFSKDSKNASTKENVGILRNAIQKHFGTIRLRCNPMGALTEKWPTINAFNHNDITDSQTAYNGNSDNNPCTVGDITTEADRYFVAGGIPVNPWSDKECSDLQKRTIYSADAAANTEMYIGNEVAAANLNSSSGFNCGWIYNESTGRIKANSNNNNRYPPGELLYESAY